MTPSFLADRRTGYVARDTILTLGLPGANRTTDEYINVDLEDLFVAQIPAIAEAFESYNRLELIRADLIFHSRIRAGHG